MCRRKAPRNDDVPRQPLLARSATSTLVSVRSRVIFDFGFMHRILAAVGKNLSWFGNAVQGIRHGADEFDNAFTAGGRDGVKLEPAFGTKVAQFFQMSAVDSSVEFRGHHNHRLVR